jgi:putative heme transporter
MRLAGRVGVNGSPDAEPTSARCLRIEIAPRTILYLLLAIGGVWIALALEAVVIVVTVALVMAGTLDPVVCWLERRGFQRGRALVLTFVAIALVLAGLMLLTVPPLLSQLMGLIKDAPAARDQLVAWLGQFQIGQPFIETIQAVPINDLVLRAGNAVIGYSSHIVTWLGYGLSIAFLAIYVLADPVRSRGLVFAVVPRTHHLKLARILLELKVIVGGYMRGQLITSASIAAFTFVLLTIFQVEDALALALFAGMTDIIPFVGGYIASFPVIVAVSGSGFGAVAFVSLVMLAYQEFESRILVPRVYGKVLRLPPAIIVVALLVGGTLMGIIGALLALPIAAGLQMIVRELRVELPGESPLDPIERARDEKAEHIYEQLAEGVPAADAGVIAGELAQTLKRTERSGATLSSELPLMRELPDAAPELPDAAPGLADAAGELTDGVPSLAARQSPAVPALLPELPLAAPELPLAAPELPVARELPLAHELPDAGPRKLAPGSRRRKDDTG